MSAIFEKGRPGSTAERLPAPSKNVVPESMRRASALKLPEVSELELVRHYTRLSHLNMSIDTHFYPLGSCTMKYNPRVNERAAALPGFAKIHPLQPAESVQGAIELQVELERDLAQISGMDAVSLQPAAGAQGELTGLLMIKAYLADHGGAARDEVLIPDSAHGTNPASCSMVGFKVVQLRTDAGGGVDLADFQKRLGPKTAAMMITNPSTLGLFESKIDVIAKKLHDAGALLYMDGANMNAILGVARPGDFGVDVMHYNLHKTFSTPHGGGGPGSGPVAVKALLEPYLPVPRPRREGGRFVWDLDRPRSIGRVKAFAGNFGMLVRAYAYIRCHGAAGLRRISDLAVLNANYVLARLRGDFDLPYDRRCMHEAIFSASRQAKLGVHATDIAKRLLDYGFHPPTIYFPLIVKEALMIEPTECEGKATLDAFCDAMIAIATEAREKPELVTGAPHTMPLKRLNQVQADRKPCVRWSAPQ